MKAKDISMLDVASLAGVEPVKRGAEWWGKCPFHADRSPSLAINTEKNVWICWAGCGGGSPVDFIMRLQGLDFQSACRWIENAFNITRDIRPRPKTVAQLQYEREKAINDEIEQTFNFCFAARQALRAELRLRSDDPPEQMIRDTGFFSTVSAEIASGEPERVTMGLTWFRGWRKWGKASQQAC